MRSHITLILKILIDNHAPEGLRGSVQPLLDDRAQFFSDEESLVTLLKEITHLAIREESVPHPLDLL
ncbi:MAG: hypothetical protein PHQ40_04385 [Anaerolineaceae bacterium]|nr:hypothetical protein [Anaerolineaceae bacterium]